MELLGVYTARHMKVYLIVTTSADSSLGGIQAYPTNIGMWDDIIFAHERVQALLSLRSIHDACMLSA